MSVESTFDFEVMKARLKAQTKLAADTAAESLNTAIKPLVPRDVGTLENEMKVAGTESDDGSATGYVANNVIYARRQHEEVTWNHPHKGQAKYVTAALEDPGTQADIKARIREHIEAALKHG